MIRLNASQARKIGLKGTAARKAKSVPYPEFEKMCKDSYFPRPIRELQFAKPRKWKFDFAWPGLLLALEVEGGVWSGGRHTRGSGFLGDIEKYNEAVLLKWRLLRCTPKEMNDGTVLELLRRASLNLCD